MIHLKKQGEEKFRLKNGEEAKKKCWSKNITWDRKQKSRNNFKRKLIIQNRINHQIRVPEVRLVDETGKQVGVVRTGEALRMAQEKGLDLIEVAAKTVPPVCRIADFGKFQYQREKQIRQQKVHQKKPA